MSHTVFISYSSKDKKMADAICHYLEHEKIKCWIAPRDVALGTNFANEIVKAIPKSKVMVIVFSGNSNSSRHVMRELELAVQNDLIVIPVRIEDIIPTGAMSFYLSTMQWVDIVDAKTNASLSLLTTRIKNIVGAITEGDEQSGKSTVPDKPFEPPNNNKYPKQKSRKKPSGNISIKKLLIGLAAVVLPAAIVISVLLMLNKPDDTPSPEPSTLTTIVRNEQSSSTPQPATPIPTEVPEPTFVPADFGLDANQLIEFEDESLKEAIYATLISTGKLTEGELLTVGHMFELDNLLIYTENSEIFLSYGPFDYHFVNEGGLDTLNGLEYAKNLRRLWIDGYEPLRDISALSELNQLELLVLTGTSIRDVEPLSNLYNLKVLHIGWNYVTSLDPIAGLTQLEDFAFASYENDVDDINAMFEFKNLTSLDLMHVKPNDFSLFSSFEHLTFLRLDECGVTDVSFVAELPNINFIAISGNNIYDLSPLENTSLNRLWIDADTYNKHLDTVNALIAKGCDVGVQE